MTAARLHVAVPWLVWGLSALLGSTALGVMLANVEMPAVRDALYLQDAGVALVFPAMGALILSRRPGHRIGWLFLMTASLSVAGLGAAYALYTFTIAPGALPGGAWAAWIASWAWTPFLAMPTLLVLLFPDGRAPSPRWGVLARLIGWWLVGLTVLAALLPGPMDPFPAQNPLGLGALAALRPVADALIAVVMVGFAPLCLAGLVWRWRHAQGDERAQLKWFVTAAVVALAGGLLGGFLPIPVLAGDALWLAGLSCLPVAAAVAIIKYRLYDIDVLIERSIVYGLLTAVVVSGYVAIVAVLGGWLSQFAASLVATGVTAVAFQPLRERLQRRIDRLLYGDRADPYGALATLGARLESTVPIAAVLPTVADAIATALNLRCVAIEVVEGDGARLAASHGRPVDDPLRLPMSYRGTVVGWLLAGPPSTATRLSPADRRLLADFARQAAATVHAVALTDQLLDSRSRLVASREEERRRLRRDLHDGLGPTLAGLTLQIAAVGQLVSSDPAAAAVRLQRLRATLQDAVVEVRRLVDGLRPPALDELGLVAAIEQHVTAMPRVDAGPTISVETATPLPDLPAAVEVAAYRIATEAALNAIRHADAQMCHIGLRFDGSLHLEITDDGRGGADGDHPGVGLRSMRERAAELGGACVITPADPHGTVVRARLPVPSA